MIVTDTISEHDAQKIGEAFAFIRVGLETLKRGADTFEASFPQETVDSFWDGAENLKNDSEGVSFPNEILDIVQATTEQAEEMLFQLRDVSIADAWDDAIELAGWLGFFHGGALAQWSLVAAIAKRVGLLRIEQLSDRAITYHQEALTNVQTFLSEVGQNA